MFHARSSRASGAARNANGWAALLVLAAWAIYLPTLDFGYIADDHVYLGIANSHLIELPWNELWRLAASPANPWEYLPLRDLSYWLDIAIHQDAQFGLHLGNFLWYGFSCAAVGFAALETLRFARPAWSAHHVALAAAASALFAAHPAHVEVVAWIASRKDLMAGTLSFVGWGLSVRTLRLGISMGRVAGLVLVWAGALLSKSPAIAALLLAILLFVLARQDGQASSRRWLVAATLAIAGVGLFVLHMGVARESGVRIDNAPGAWVVAERASRIFSSLVELQFIPSDGRVIRDVFAISHHHLACSLVAGVLALVAVARLVRTCGRSLFGWAVLWSVVPLVPYLQLQPFSTWSMASERFTFPATFGVTLVALCILGRLFFWPRMMLVSALAVSGVFIAARNLPAWQSEATLWAREASRDTHYFNSVRPHAIRLLNERQADAAEHLAQGIGREDARRLLLGYLAWRRFEQELAPGWFVNDPSSRARFCREGMTLLDAVRAGYAGIPQERDIPYNNFLRNMEQEINPSGRLARACSRAG